MTKILALDHKTDRLTAELNNLGEKLFWLDEHNQKKAGAHSFTFTMPAGIKEAKAFGKRSRFLIPLEDNGFQEFIVFKSTTFNKKKEIKGTAAYSEMETDYIVEPGTYTGKVDELANLVLPYTDYVLGVFEDIRIRTIYVEEHIGAYSFLTKIASAFDLEMHFRSEVAGTRFTGRYLDYVKKVGADLKKEVVYGVDLIDMKMTVHDDRIATALIGIGPEREDGTRLTSYVENEDAFQRWNRKGRHITRIYRPDSDRQDMSQAELDQYTETELTKRIASVVEYEITAASLEREFPHAKIRYGSTLRVKNPIFNPPLYADARVIGVRRSIADPSKKTYVIGEVKTYTEDEIYKTFRQLQAQYNLRVVRSEEKPPGSSNKIWVQIVVDATGVPTGMEVPHVWSTQLNDWVKIAPTTAAEIGAETPAGAQEKANAAEQAAKDHAEQKDTEQAQIINQTINQTRIDLETDLAAKAGLTYVDGKFSLIDSDLSAMLGDINMITGDVSGITSRVDGLQATSSDLQTRVALNEDALLAGNGRMTTIETDVNELEGTMSTTITQLSNLDGKVTNQQTQINANADAITLKASQASLDTLTGEVSDINAELSVQAGQIALKAEQSALTTVDGKVTGLQSDVSSLVVDVEGVTTSVSSLRTDFDGLEIGGRNFVQLGNLTSYTPYNTKPTASGNKIVTTFTRAGYANTYTTWTLNIPGFIPANDIYTISGYVKINGSIPAFETWSYSSGAASTYGSDVSKNYYDPATGRFVITQKYPGTSGFIFHKTSRLSTGDVIELDKLKFEKGNKATDWTPALEDVDLSISNVQQYASTIDQKADSIISDVTALTQTVDGHTTSISNAQSSITQLSNSIALKAEQTQVDSIAGQVSSVESDVSSLTVDVNGITSNVSSLRSDLDGLEIGGRNFVQLGNLTSYTPYNTKPTASGNKIVTTFTRAGYANTYTTWTLNIPGFIPANDIYTISGYVKINGSIPAFETWSYSSGAASTYGSDVSKNYYDPATGRFVITQKYPGTSGFIFHKTSRLSTGDVIELDKLKFEKGNKATDWTPALEDVDLSISNVQQYASTIDQKADSIISDVTALTQTVDGHTTSISNAQSSITQLSNSIALKAEQTQVDSIAGQVSSVESDVSSLTVDVNGITSNVSSLRSDLDGLEIGGRNLFLGSDHDPMTRTITIYGETSYFGIKTFESLGLKNGDAITASAYFSDIPEGEGMQLRFDWMRADNSYVAFTSNATKATENGRVTIVGVIPTSEEFTGIRVRLSPTNFTANYEVKISGFKLEKGNIATDWTPAPEDIDAAVDAVGSRVTSAESEITQLSNSINLKASQASLDSLAGRMSSAESELTVQAGQIALKVSEEDYNGNKIASLINQTATTISIQASKINLVGAVNVLSEISGQLGNITAGTISGVTFTSESGKKSFTLSNGLAEFMEDRSLAGVTLGTRTAINEDGVKIENTYYGIVEHMSNLTAQHLLLKGDDSPFTEYGLDKIRLLAGSISEFNIYPNWSLTTIQSAGDMDIVAGGNKLSLYTSTLLYNGKPIGFSDNEIIWSGALYMRDGQSVTPTRKLSDCPTGWILVWSRYVNGAAAGSDWNFTIVPKIFADFGGGSWHTLPATNSGTVGVAPPVAYKYIYATSTQLIGHTRNDDGAESGQVLRYVLAF